MQGKDRSLGLSSSAVCTQHRHKRKQIWYVWFVASPPCFCRWNNQIDGNRFPLQQGILGTLGAWWAQAGCLYSMCLIRCPSFTKTCALLCIKTTALARWAISPVYGGSRGMRKADTAFLQQFLPSRRKQRISIIAEASQGTGQQWHMEAWRGSNDFWLSLCHQCEWVAVAVSAVHPPS